MIWVASASFVDKVAWATPFCSASRTGGCAWPSMKKVTVPVGVAASAMVTVAVSVTTWPTIEGFGATVSCVVVSIFGLITTTPLCFLGEAAWVGVGVLDHDLADLVGVGLGEVDVAVGTGRDARGAAVGRRDHELRETSVAGLSCADLVDAGLGEVEVAVSTGRDHVSPALLAAGIGSEPERHRWSG